MTVPRSASRIAALAGVSLVALVFTYCAGRSSGRDAVRHATIDSMLTVNARELAVARARGDTTHRAAVVATVATATHRATTRAVQQRVTIIDSSTVRLRLVDSLATVTLPPLVVTELHDDRDQIDADENAIALWVANDSAHLEIERRLDERTQVLEGAVRQEAHAGFTRGVKVGAGAAALLALILHFTLR